MVFENVSDDSKLTLNFIIGGFFILLIIFTAIPPLRQALSVYLFSGALSFIIYSLPLYQDWLFGLSKKNGFISFFFGGLAGLAFYLLGRAVPGFAVTVPILPAAVSDSFKFFVIVFVSPWFETIIIQGALFGYFRYLFRNVKGGDIYALVGQALFFALWHLGAYILGFYQLPGFGVALSSAYANIGAFLTAFIFAIVAGAVVMIRGVRNLIFVGFFHMALNILIYTSLTVVFIILSLL